MSIRIVLSLCAVALVALAARADDELPKPQAFARYDAMTNRSPFAVATAVAPPPQAPNFAKDLYIANAAKLSDEGVVTLSSNVDKNMKEYLSTKAPNKSGYSISNIEWSEKIGETKVTISKEGQFATLGFNQALLSQPLPVGNPNVPTTGIPVNNFPQPVTVNQPLAQPASGVAVPPPMPAMVRPPGGAPIPTPPPHVRGVIPRTVPAPPPPQNPGREDQ